MPGKVVVLIGQKYAESSSQTKLWSLLGWHMWKELPSTMRVSLTNRDQNSWFFWSTVWDTSLYGCCLMFTFGIEIVRHKSALLLCSLSRFVTRQQQRGEIHRKTSLDRRWAHPKANDVHVPLPLSEVCQNPQCAGFFSLAICFNLEKTFLSALK